MRHIAQTESRGAKIFCSCICFIVFDFLIFLVWKERDVERGCLEQHNLERPKCEYNLSVEKIECVSPKNKCPRSVDLRNRYFPPSNPEFPLDQREFTRNFQLHPIFLRENKLEIQHLHSSRHISYIQTVSAAEVLRIDFFSGKSDQTSDPTKMALFKKLAVFGAVATAYVRANDDAELDDMDNDDMPAMPEGMPGMPGMPEGMDMEKLQEMIANMGAGAGGEGGMPEGMDPEKMQEMMAGMKAPPAAKAVAVYNSTEDLTSALKGRKPSEALFVFEGAEDSAAHEAAKKVLADPKAFASVALLKTDGEAKLTLYKGGEETVTFDGDFADAEKVGAWAVENRVPAFGQIDQDNFEIYVESAKKGRGLRRGFCRVGPHQSWGLDVRAGGGMIGVFPKSISWDYVAGWI